MFPPYVKIQNYESSSSRCIKGELSNIWAILKNENNYRYPIRCWAVNLYSSWIRPESGVCKIQLTWTHREHYKITVVFNMRHEKRINYINQLLRLMLNESWWQKGEKEMRSDSHQSTIHLTSISRWATPVWKSHLHCLPWTKSKFLLNVESECTTGIPAVCILNKYVCSPHPHLLELCNLSCFYWHFYIIHNSILKYDWQSI